MREHGANGAATTGLIPVMAPASVTLDDVRSTNAVDMP